MFSGIHHPAVKDSVTRFILCLTVREAMKAYSYHFIFDDNTQYRDLLPVFPDILKIILAENDHFQSQEDEENREMFIAMNMYDLEENRKPEGYNRKGKYRLIFPMDRKEMYVRTFVGKANDVRRIGEKISEMLSTAHVKFTSAENDNIAFD